MKELRMMGCGGAIDTDRLTASPEHVRKGDVFYGSGSDEEQTGTLPDRTEDYDLAINGKPMVESDEILIARDENGQTRIALSPPGGEYPGNGDAYIGVTTGEIGITRDVIACGKTVCGVVGGYGEDGNATSKDIRDGMIAYGRNGEIRGSAVDYGNAAKTLACGESYTINEGMYGSGKITAKDLASQTSGDAAAAYIVSGKKAWVGGKQVTGSMADQGEYQNARNNECGVSGDYFYTHIPGGYYHSNGSSWAPESRANMSLVRSALGITADKIKKGQTVGGVAGTYGNIATIHASAYKGLNASSPDPGPYEESFTMPANGTVVYDGVSFSYHSYNTVICEIYKNGSVVDSRNIDSSNDYVWRGTMYGKSFSANKGDVIKVKAQTSASSHSGAWMNATIIY